ASRELQRRIFGDPPYARYPLGQRRKVRAIKRRHLVQWWTTFARPDAAVLYVAGDVTAEEGFTLAKQYFGDWTAVGLTPDVEVPPPPEPKDTHIYLVDNPRAVQSEIRVGQISFGCKHRDYHKADVFSQIFGGSFGSRLNKAIRVERGLTYGAHGGFSAERFAGRFVGGTSTKTESTTAAVRTMLDVIEDMRATPPSNEELTSAKSYLVGRVPSEYETALDTVNAQWRIECYGLPRDDLQRSITDYKAAETDDIVRIANEHIDLDKLTIVVVGDAKKIKENLEAIAPVTVVR
ncbi:MAG: insulinase family protein, partial [Candidatus Hydrogenedentes bacterium]|nr:insulinase family protein [Candidatus Hydrogenedentota bacterium]